MADDAEDRLEALPTACCMEEFPELHERTIRRQLYAAQIEDTLKKELGPSGPKKLGDIPEKHLRPLVSVKNDDEQERVRPRGA